jgi:hypothetical protein
MLSKITIGIDPGYRTGGVALLGDNFAEVHDLPVYTEGGVDVIALLDIINSAGPVEHIWLEKQQAMPKQGVVSVFKLGFRLRPNLNDCRIIWLSVQRSAARQVEVEHEFAKG